VAASTMLAMMTPFEVPIDGGVLRGHRDGDDVARVARNAMRALAKNGMP